MLKIRTPEGVVFSQALASPLSRFLALLVDFAVITGLSMIIGTAFGILGFLTQDVARGLAVLSYFVVSVGYAMLLEWVWRGQTLGKKVMRLRVVDARGLRLQFHQVVIRNLMRYVDQLPVFYCVGGLISAVTRKGQRLGDIAADTVVVRVEQKAEPNLSTVMGDKYNSLRGQPALAAKIRQRVSPAAASVALRALLRRHEMEAAPRALLFAEIAAHFRSLLEIRAEDVEEIGDEQFIRNMVEILYQVRASAGPANTARAANDAPQFQAAPK